MYLEGSEGQLSASYDVNVVYQQTEILVHY